MTKFIRNYWFYLPVLLWLSALGILSLSAIRKWENEEKQSAVTLSNARADSLRVLRAEAMTDSLRHEGIRAELRGINGRLYEYEQFMRSHQSEEARINQLYNMDAGQETSLEKIRERLLKGGL
jgi:hypothetical protein